MLGGGARLGKEEDESLIQSINESVNDNGVYIAAPGFAWVILKYIEFFLFMKYLLFIVHDFFFLIYIFSFFFVFFFTFVVDFPLNKQSLQYIQVHISFH